MSQIENNITLPPPTPPTSSTKRFSRDEMNLAEFPLTVLSTRCDPSIKTLEFQDSITSKNGEIIQRKWVITGADKFGLPTATDDEVLLALIKMTVDDGFHKRKVYFTRYELLKVLHWTTEGRSYSRLQSSLDRLSGVRIKATNAFYDNDTKSHSTKNFGVIDAYEINDGRDNVKPSFFIWSEEIFKSFQAGFIKKLDLDFYLSLKSAVSKRLYRYLDKHFWYKSRVHMKLFLLAHEKIGISRNYQYASSIRQQLDPALEELIDKKVVSRFEYEGKGRETEITIYAYTGIPRVLTQAQEKSPVQVSQAPNLSTKTSERNESQEDLINKLTAKLIARGLRESQVQKLLNGKSPQMLEKIDAIVAYYDRLLSAKSTLISRSPIGFLYRAVENAETFILPASAAVPSSSRKNLLLSERDDSRDALEAAFQRARELEVAKVKASIEPQLLERITKDVEKSLAKL